MKKRVFLALVSMTWLQNLAQAEFTVPVHLGATTSSVLFDESVNVMDGFSVFQRDPKLQDLFSPAGKSALCFPTTFANIVAYQKLWREPSAYPLLPIVQDPLTGDYTQQVRTFAKLCYTDPTNGTIVTDALACMKQYYIAAGYPNPHVDGLGKIAGDPAHPFVTVDDIRESFTAGDELILQVDFDKFDAANGSWVKNDGHYAWIAGYDYDKSWGDNQIILKVVNPDVDYSTTSPELRFNSVFMMKLPQKPGMTFPSFSNYILQGTGFSGVTTRAFVKSILRLNPAPSVR